MDTASASLLAILQLLATAVHDLHGVRNVSLTVSSLRLPIDDTEQNFVERQLELNWEHDAEIDWIGLFNGTPPQKADEVSDAVALIRINPENYPDGFYRTNVSFDRQPFPAGWNQNADDEPVAGDTCFPYWIGAYKNDELLQVDCLKIRPTWMWDHREQLGDMPLSSLFIPGTHNSGSYHKENSAVANDGLNRYLITQDTDVWGQLVHGIRYLDIRVGYYPNHGKSAPTTSPDRVNRYWVNHDLVNVRALVPVLQDIKEFLKKSENEIVILDFHRFPVGFHGHPSRHRRLATLIYMELGEFVLPFANSSYNATLEEIWSTGRNLIVAYGDGQTTKEFPWLWGPIPQMWGNQQDADGLKEFLQQCMENASMFNTTTFWAAMAELTPAPINVMFGPTTSLREMADMVNRNITKWFHTYWWNTANVVATDYFLGNNVIDVAIKSSLDRAKDVIVQI